MNDLNPSYEWLSLGESSRLTKMFPTTTLFFDCRLCSTSMRNGIAIGHIEERRLDCMGRTSSLIMCHIMMGCCTRVLVKMIAYCYSESATGTPTNMKHRVCSIGCYSTNQRWFQCEGSVRIIINWNKRCLPSYCVESSTMKQHHKHKRTCTCTRTLELRCWWWLLCPLVLLSNLSFFFGVKTSRQIEHCSQLFRRLALDHDTDGETCQVQEWLNVHEIGGSD